MNTLRDRFMIFALTHYGSLRIEGPDAKKFLQGQLTCNLEQLTLNQSLLGAHCNPKGRVISLFHCIYHHDYYTLVMPREMVPIAELALKKYAVFFKVTCSESNDDHLIGGMTPHFNIQIKPKKQDDKYNTSKIEWEQLCIKEKIPVILQDTSQTFLPHELNLNALNAISFDKGCYTGQEIIARMHYRSEIKYQLHHANAHSKSKLTVGSDIFQLIDNSPKVIGRIVNLIETTPNEYQLLITIKQPYLETQSLFINQLDDTPVELNILGRTTS